MPTTNPAGSSLGSSISTSEIEDDAVTEPKLAVGVFEELATNIVTGAPSTITFTGLDGDTYNYFLALCRLLTSGANTIYLYANNDTTSTNYYRQRITGDHNTIAGDRTNEPEIAESGNAGPSGLVYITRNEADYLDVRSNLSYINTGTPWLRTAQMSSAGTISNITRLDFATSAGTFVADTFIQLYGAKTKT